MYLEKPPKDTMGVIYASVHRRMMGFSMRWRSTIGLILPSTTYSRVSSTNPGRVVTHADYPQLEKIAESAIKDRQKFERLLVSKEKLLDMFHVSRELQ